MGAWTLLGPVVATQIHTDRMIVAGRYCHELIREVDTIWVGADGVVGVVGSEAILHAHHRLHPNKQGPDARNFRPDRLLSFGFTGHYSLMADHFGSAPPGCAGEDLIVACGRRVELDEVAGGVQLRRGDRVVELVDAAVANPCVPFTKYLLEDQNTTEESVAANRAFLNDGMRGFVVGLANHIEPVDITVGDEFWVRES